MSKTAEEWQETLGLDWMPDEAEVADLNAVEGLEFSGGQLADSAFTVMTPPEIRAAVTVDSVGELFQRLRNDAAHSVRSLAEQTGMSAARVSQIEQPSANLTIKTVAEMADRLGYDAALVLRPRNDRSITFEAPLGKSRKEG